MEWIELNFRLPLSKFPLLKKQVIRREIFRLIQISGGHHAWQLHQEAQTVTVC